MIRTAAIVHLDALEHNIRLVQSKLSPGVEIMAVMKGDGYGHGIAGIYPTMKKCGIKRYAAAVWEEGAALRNAGAESEPILLLGDTWDEQLPEVIRYRLTPTIFCLDTARKLNDLAREAGIVQPIHIKLDTGMSRIGFPADETSLPDILTIAKMENLAIEGVFTHFARADELDCDAAPKQFAKYLVMIEAMENAGIKIPLRHTANSPSIMLRPEVQLDAVRAGDVLYGLCPVDEKTWAESGFREVMTWQTYVALVKTIPAGTEVGYGGTFVAKRPTRIATIPVGFADGYNRRLSNRGFVSIRGCEAPIIGRVCMDQFMVDITDIPNVQRGDEVTLLGGDLTILRMADLLDINVDEVVCGISKRVPRIYK